MRSHRFTIGAVLIAASLVYLLVTSVEQSAARHVTLSTLLEEGDWNGRRLQLGGSTVVVGSIQWDQFRHRPEFEITDGVRNLRVRYSGNSVLPDTFKDEAQVVLEGQYDASEERFDAKVIFAKCPSKYEGQDYQGHIDAMETRT